MSLDQQSKQSELPPGYGVPWYKQFWPWFIIALPTSAVIACFYTLWLAISNPDQLVVTDDEYQQLRSDLKAQTPDQESEQKLTDGLEAESNKDHD